MTEKKTIQVAGMLIWQDWEFFLLDLHPHIEREHWMKDSDEMFTVMDFGGNVFDVIVSRPFLITRKNLGERREVKATQLEEVAELDEMQKITHKLFSNVTN